MAASFDQEVKAVPQPTPYERQYDFSDFQQGHPSEPLPGNKVDAELDAVKLTLDQTLRNLKLIQRDDGRLANRSVGRDQLDSSISLGFNAPSEWEPDTVYTIYDTVFYDAKFYRGAVDHVSSETFDPDKWILVADFTQATSDAEAAAERAEDAQAAAEAARDIATSAASTAAADASTAATKAGEALAAAEDSLEAAGLALTRANAAEEAAERAEDAQAAAEAAAEAAGDAESNAVAARDKAEQWAENDEDVEVDPGRYSAKHYAAKAAASAAILDLTGLGAIGGVTSINGGPLGGFRNKIINGNFDIWQRGTTFLGVSTGAFGPDRWIVQTFSGSTVDLSRIAGPNRQSRYALRVQKATHPTADSPIEIDQRIEGLRRFSGKTITITFDLRVNREREFHIWLQGRYGTGGSPSPLENYYSGAEGDAVTISPGTGWARFRKVYTVPDLSSKTFGTNEDDSLVIRFRDPYSVLNDWFDLARVSVVEGNAGSEDDPFEDRPLGVELALCQRYYQAGRAWYYGVRGSSLDGGNVQITFPVQMRATPAITIGGTFSLGDLNVDTNSITALSPTAFGFGFQVKPVVLSEAVRCGRIYSADAEL